VLCENCGYKFREDLDECPNCGLKYGDNE